MTLLVMFVTGAWAYTGVSGDVDLIKVGSSGKAVKLVDGCYAYRPSSGYSWSDGNGLKTQSNQGSVIFYIDKTTDVTVDIKHTESKNAHTVTANIYSLSEDAYSEFYTKVTSTSSTSVTFSLPSSTSSTFDIEITAETKTFTGTKQLAAGYYAIVCTGDSNDKGKAFFNAIHFAVADTREPAPISWSASSAEAVIGESNTYPSLSNTEGLTVTYASSNTSVASFADASSYAITLNSVGKTNITATYTSPNTSAQYRTTTVSYELTVRNLVAQSNKFWKFSDSAWDDKTTLNSETGVVDNLEPLFSSSSATIRDVNMSIDGITFTKELNIGKANNATDRVLHIRVAPNSKITAYGRPNGDDRTLTISNGSYDSSDKVQLSMSTNTTAYKAELLNLAGGDVYIYGEVNTINIFGIKVAPIHSVTYALNGGTGTIPTETVKGEGDKFTLHDGTTGITAPEGMVFDGWNDGTTTYAAGGEYTMGTSDVTLTAQWRVPATKHSVTYNLNGGTGTAPTQEDVEEGAEFTVAGTEGISAPENKRFSTWNDGTNDYAPSATYTMGTVDVTLTALWIDVYAITKGTHANGDFTITPASAEEGETVTLTATPNFKYVLDSWSVYKTGDPTTTVTVTDNKFTMPAYAVTVDATFAADPKKQVLYLTSDGNVNENDKLYAALAEDYTVTKAKYDATKTVTDFDLVVFHESIGGTNHGTGLVKAAIEADVPVLNTKSYFYNDGRWGWGTPNAGTSVAGATLNPAYGNTASHPIFDGVTISDPGFVTLFSSAEAKAMQPVTDLVSGKEGYTLAITPNASSGNGVAIHELTPAQRGVTNAKYLMVSIGNANGCFEKLTANGQKLLKNAAAYLIDNTASWTPTTIVEGTIAANKEWITFCSTANLDFSSDIAGLEGAYTITAHADKATALTATKMTGKVKAGTGLLLRAAAVDATNPQVITIPVATTGDEQADNMLKGVTVDTEVQPTAGDYTNLGLSNGEFHPYSAAGTLAAGKAYLQVPTAQMPTGGNNARLYIVLDGEATGINAIENSELRIENLDAPMYNLAGQRVTKSYKGVVIVNGKKYINK